MFLPWLPCTPYGIRWYLRGNPSYGKLVREEVACMKPKMLLHLQLVLLLLARIGWQWKCWHLLGRLQHHLTQHPWRTLWVISRTCHLQTSRTMYISIMIICTKKKLLTRSWNWFSAEAILTLLKKKPIPTYGSSKSYLFKMSTDSLGFGVDLVRRMHLGSNLWDV